MAPFSLTESETAKGTGSGLRVSVTSITESKRVVFLA
jgi:hypothetical protein